MRSEDYKFLYDLEDSFWWFVGMREIAATLLDPLCSTSTQTRCVLDAGCGTGGNLEWLKRYAGAGNVIGIDLSAEALDFCRASRHQSLARASVTELPFTDAAFDLFTSFDVLVQLPRAGDAQKALREMYRVLKPGGIAFIRVAAYEWMHSEHDDELGTAHRYNLMTLLNLITQVGFHPLRATYANALLLPVAAIRRLVLKRIGLSARGSDVKPLSPRLRWLNRMLIGLLHQEARWLRRPRAKLRAGLSVICVAEKPREIIEDSLKLDV